MIEVDALVTNSRGKVFQVVKVDEQYQATWVYVIPRGAESTVENRSAYGIKVFEAKFKKYEEEK